MDDYKLWIVLAGCAAVVAAVLLVWAITHRRAQLAQAARRDQGDWQHHDSVSGESLDADDSLPQGELPSNAMARARADAAASAARKARTAREGRSSRSGTPTQPGRETASQGRQAADLIIQREIEQAALRRTAARRAREAGVEQELQQQAAAAAAERAATLSASQQKAALAASRLRAERLAGEQRAAAEAAERRAAKEAAQQDADEAAAQAAQAALLAEQAQAQKLAVQAAERVAQEQAAETANLATNTLASALATERARLAALESTAQAIEPSAEDSPRRAQTIDTPARRSPQETLVMVADDSKVVRVKTSRLLALHHYRVVLAEDGFDALHKMADEAPHVLITDVEMPGMDGFALTRHVRGQPHLAHIPIIMITSAHERLQQAASDAGVTVLLGKPYPEAELMARIEQANHSPSAVSTATLG